MKYKVGISSTKLNPGIMGSDSNPNAHSMGKDSKLSTRFSGKATIMNSDKGNSFYKECGGDSPKRDMSVIHDYGKSEPMITSY